MIAKFSTGRRPQYNLLDADSMMTTALRSTTTIYDIYDKEAALRDHQEEGGARPLEVAISLYRPERDGYRVSRKALKAGSTNLAKSCNPRRCLLNSWELKEFLNLLGSS